MYEQVITIASPIFIILIILELLIGHKRGQSNYHFGDTLNSMSLGMLMQITNVFVKVFTPGFFITTLCLNYRMPGGFGWRVC